MMVVCGVPLYFMEYSMGKFSGKGLYEVWDISPLFRGIGIAICLGYCSYMVFSTVFRCWVLDMMIISVQNPIPWNLCNNDWNTGTCSVAGVGNETATVIMNYTTSLYNTTYFPMIANGNLTSAVSDIKMTAPEEFWQYRILELSSGITDMSPIRWQYWLYVLIIRLVVFAGMFGSMKSIEKFFNVSAPIPTLLITAILIHSLTLPGATDGLYFFFKPDFSQLRKIRVWIEAILMSFYTLLFGWGGTIKLSSHADFRENSFRTSVVVPFIDNFSAMYSGMVCFSVLGNMAHLHGIHITKVIQSGMSTGIVAYIAALSPLPLPQLWSFLFLFALFLNGIEAQIVPMEMTMSLLCEIFPALRSRFRVLGLIILTVAIGLLSLVTCNGAGAYMFLWNDWYVGAWLGFIVAGTEVVVVAWIYGLDRFDEDVKLMLGRRLPAPHRIVLAFISPILIATIFAVSCGKYVPPKLGSYTYPLSVRILGWMSVALVLSPIFIKAAMMVYKSEGSLAKKIRGHSQPASGWVPIEEELRESYSIHKLKYDRRTLKDLFHYNVFGRYPKGSSMYIDKIQELENMAVGLEKIKTVV